MIEVAAVGSLHLDIMVDSPRLPRLDETLIGKFRNGKSAVFIIFQTPEEGSGIPVSLNGFGGGFDTLK